MLILIRSLFVLALQFDPCHLVESGQGELLFCRFCVLQLRSCFQKITEVFRASLQLLLAVSDYGSHKIIPRGLTFSYLLNQVNCGWSHKAGRIIKKAWLHQCQFKDILGKMLILGLESYDFAEGFKELVGRVDDELEVEMLDYVSLHCCDLLGCVLVSTAGD